MNQLPPMPKLRPWWRRTDFFLVMLSVVVALLALRLFGGISPVTSELTVAPYAEEPPYAALPPLTPRQVDEMPESGPPVRFLMLNAD